MPSPSTEVPLAFSWRKIRQRGAAWCTSGSLVPISGAPVGVYPRLHTLEELGQLPRVLGQEGCQSPGQLSVRLLRAARGNGLEALYVLAVTTGMRQVELLALRWQDVDIKNGIVSVRRTLTRSGGPYTLGAPKTKKSRRSIRLTPRAIEALEAHLDRQLHEMGIL
jgi:integrase